MRVLRLKTYLRAMAAMGLDDGVMRAIELDIIRAPEAHPVIKGLRGARKARIAMPGRGKSGGGRVVYFVQAGADLFMMTAYQKNEQDDLTPAQRKAILSALESIKGASR
ncbi:type II toxin-antitoxin system RelE/ParE family toxin [Rhizobium sp.]